MRTTISISQFLWGILTSYILYKLADNVVVEPKQNSLRMSCIYNRFLPNEPFLSSQKSLIRHCLEDSSSKVTKKILHNLTIKLEGEG